jgi:hypothetical protein
MTVLSTPCQRRFSRLPYRQAMGVSEYHGRTIVRHRLIPAALGASGSILLLAGTAMAATPAWTVVPAANPAGAGLNAVSARTASDAWAVGQFQGAGEDAGSQMLTERWNGTSWQQVPTTNINFEDEHLLAVSASGANDAWAVGIQKGINAASRSTLAAHWDGTAWTIVPTPATVSGGRGVTLNGVADLSPTNAWAVGEGKDARPLAEHWNGSAWSVVPVPGPAAPAGTSFANAVLSSISAVSPTDIWAVGTTTATQTQTLATSRFTLAEHWNGTAWSIVKSANTAEPTALNGVTAISATNAWAVGNGFNNVHDTSATDANRAVIEHWNGTAWSIVASPATVPQLGSVSAASATDIWATGTAIDASGSIPVNVTRAEHWNGTAWSVVASPNGSGGDTILGGVSALPSGEAWAAGAVGSTTGGGAFIIHHTP